MSSSNYKVNLIVILLIEVKYEEASKAVVMF